MLRISEASEAGGLKAFMRMPTASPSRLFLETDLCAAHRTRPLQGSCSTG